MPAGPRSEPLGWLAPLAAAPQAAVLGARIGHDDTSLVWPVGAAVAGAALAALSAAWVTRERSPWRLFGRLAASAMLTGGVGVPAAWAALELLVGEGARGPQLLSLGFMGALGTVLGLAYGLGAGLALALALRLHRGPSRHRLAMAIIGAAWTASAVGILASSEWRQSELVLPLLVCGVATLVLSPLVRKSDAQSVEVEDEAPRHTTAWRGWVGAAYLFGPGLSLGLVVLGRAIPRDMLPRESIDLLAAGLAPAVLAALVGAWSIRARSPAWVWMRALLACTIAGSICAPLTYLVLRAATLGAVELDLRTFWLVSIFGGAIGVPTGLALGVGFGAALAAVTRLCRGALARSLERASLGAVWLAAGATAALLDLWAGPSELFDWAIPMQLSNAVLAVALLVMATGLVLGAPAALRVARAWRLLSQARRGRRPDYAIVARGELDADEAVIAALPAYLPFGRLDAVLVRRIDPAGAPFRHGTVSELVALVPGS